MDGTHPATLVSSASYAPNGFWSTAYLGNGTHEVYSYGSRWLTGMQLMTAGGGTLYSFTLSHAPDAQITGSTDSLNGNWAYTFDEFNRLRTATKSSGGTVLTGLSWDYDRYGNRWNQNLTGGSGIPTTASFSGSTNRATTALSQDAAGNVFNDTMHNYVYDAENRIASVDGGVGYIYDAEGRRVGKTDGTVYTVDASGGVLDEVNGSTWMRSEILLGGRHLATVNTAGVIFVHSDWIGTERARSNMSATICESATSQPFGDNVQKAGSCDVSPDFFTGKPRDTESNLDDFGARYFSSQWGRWMSADWTAAPSSVPYATLTNPQSLNLYAYVGNDPIDGQDADGHARYIPPTTSQVWTSAADADSACMFEIHNCITSPSAPHDQVPPAPSADSTTPASAQQQGSVEDRVIIGAAGAANVYVGADKAAASVVAAISTPVTTGARGCCCCLRGVSGRPVRWQPA